ncbi:MAG: carbon-nitrogen hydrolase family protein, partial [Pelagibacteraceae bacterium]|nr:carbon-nitrogen hydrolase family protein [Pelagibacteraceae bacterium]
KTKKFKSNLICTPECSNIITNDLNYLRKNTTFENDCPIINMAKLYAKENNVNINLGSLLLKVKNKKKLVNRSYFINTMGKIVKKYDKIHMFDVNINKKETHRESDTFQAGSDIVLLNIDKIKIGFTICYDLRFPNLFRKIAKKGAQIILMPAAFTVPSGKAHWEVMLRSRAIENSLFIIATNMCGTHHTDRKTYGHSMLINPWGKIISQAKSKQKILNTVINIEEVKNVRNKIPAILND